MSKQAVAVAIMVLVAPGAFAGKPDKQEKMDKVQQDVILLQTVSVIANEVEASNVGASTLSHDQIETRQASSVQELLDTLPATSLVGSPRAGGQTINIQGFGSMDVEHVQLKLDGAPKQFRKYQQGSLFLEPELLKSVDVGKGPHSSMNGNGGFGGVVNMKTKDAKDLLKPGQVVGGMVKTGFHSNNHLELYSGTVYAGDKDNPFDVLVNITKRRAGNMKEGDGNTFNYSGMNFLSGLAKVGYDFGNGHEISLTHISGRDASRVPWAAKAGLFDGYAVDELYRKTVWRETDDTNTIFKHQFTSPSVEWLNTDLTLSYVDTKQHDTRPEEASKYSGSNMGNENWTHYKTLFAELKNNQLIETSLLAHDLTYGVQYLQGKQDTLMLDLQPTHVKSGEYNHGLYQPWYMPSGKQTTMSVFFQDEVSWNDLTITPSLRYDHVVNQGVENLAPRFNNPAAGHDYSQKSYSDLSST
ncbi:TonB-dependent receptor plug domain-containing protein [Endozoicomonas sp. Mp262]|uniref:TonB-dependent receptor plug domain-containing protein n=1 Tax=Endozoicomonas sp. Mp262 TaxID=2919499 RepID=UPI0021D84023